MTTKTKKKKAASLDGMVPENECVKNCAACTFDECNGHGAYPRRAPQNGAGAQAAPPTDQAAAAFELIALNLIRPTKDNPRRINMADSKMRELIESIKVHGVICPVLLRPHPSKPGEYDLRAGERRYRAALAAGMWAIPAIIRPMDDRQALEVTIIENLERDNLQPLEEAKGINSLLREGWTVDQVAHQLGKPAGWVARRAGLKKLDSRIAEAAQGSDAKLNLSHWSASHLELVAALTPELQADLHKAMVGQASQAWMDHPGTWTLAELNAEIAEALRVIKKAPWKPGEAGLAGHEACTACTRRSGCQPELFASLAEEVGADRGGKAAREIILGADDTCMDVACWDEKRAAWLARRHGELEAKNDGLELVREDYHTDSEVKADPLLGKAKLRLYDIDQCKKGDKGAKPAMIVDGARAGELIWMKPQTGRRGSSTGKSKAELKKDLDDKRLQNAMGYLQHRLKGMAESIKSGQRPDAPMKSKLIAVAAVFGVQGDSRFETKGANTKPVDLWDRAKGFFPGIAEIALCEKAYEKLAEMARYVNYYNAKEQEKQAQAICDYIGLDWTAFRAEAAEKTRVPAELKPAKGKKKTGAKLAQEDLDAEEAHYADDGKPAKAKGGKKKVKPGTCQYCGCTEDHACEGGCSWANSDQTICTNPECLRKAMLAGEGLDLVDDDELADLTDDDYLDDGPFDDEDGADELDDLDEE